MNSTWKISSMKNIAIVVNLICLALFIVGCSTPWAPEPQGIRKNRMKFYETSHWPYADEYPAIKVPAQIAAGVPVLPAIIVMTPFTLFLSKEPTYDMGMAVLLAEKLYMEYPGYAIYRTVGFPMYLVKEGLFRSGIWIYECFSGEDEDEAFVKANLKNNLEAGTSSREPEPLVPVEENTKSGTKKTYEPLSEAVSQ